MYAPKLKYSDDKTRPKPLGKHPFAWLRYVLFTATEDEYLEKTGLDAVVYIRFTAMCRNIFAILSLFGLLVILPINVIYNRKSPNAQSVSKTDAFILTTPILLYGNVTLAHVTITYIFDAIICYFLWRNYEKIIEMRRRLFCSEEYQNALFMRSLMLTEIPKKYKTDDGIILLMQKLKSMSQRPIQHATVGRDVGQLNKLMSKYNESVLKLESVLAKYLKTPDRLPPTRPLMKPFKGDRDFVPTGTKKVDAIDYLSSRIQKYEAKIFDTRESIDTKKTLPYGFVSYESVEEAHAVAQAISSGKAKKRSLKATLAPRPEDIIWENIVLTTAERRSKQIWGNFLFFLLTFAWIGPNALIGAFLSNLSRIATLWAPFGTFMNNYPVLFSILQGIIAPVITALIFLMMPAIMRRMSHWQGKVTKHDREIDVTKKLYSFFVFNNIFVFTLFSVVWAIVAQIIYLVNNRTDLSFSVVMREIDIAYKISTAIMNASSFWVMYILRVNFGAVLDLLQLFRLVWRGFQRHFMSPTPRQQIMWTAPQHFNFAANYNWMLFYSTIALCFAMIQPLVLIVITLYFTLDIMYKKYGLMYMFVTKAESDGLFWPVLFNSFWFATIFGNLVLFVVVWVQGGWRNAAAMAPLLPLLIAFKVMSHRRHNPRFFFFMPTDQEKFQMESSRLRSTLSDTSSTALARRYRNPVLDSQLMVPMIHSKSQHLLPQIAALNSLGTDPEIDPEAAFMAMDDNRGFGDTSYNPGGAEGDGSNFRRSQVRSCFLDGRFDIVNDEELTYDHILRIANMEPVPDSENPYLDTYRVPAQKAETQNDGAIAAALAEPHYSRGSSETVFDSSRPSLSHMPSNPFLQNEYNTLDDHSYAGGTTHYYGNDPAPSFNSRNQSIGSNQSDASSHRVRRRPITDTNPEYSGVYRVGNTDDGHHQQQTQPFIHPAAQESTTSLDGMSPFATRSIYPSESIPDLRGSSSEVDLISRYNTNNTTYDDSGRLLPDNLQDNGRRQNNPYGGGDDGDIGYNPRHH